MCGLAGFIGYKRLERAQVLANMMATIRHRGPDDSGTFVNEIAALGHQRLSIIDIDNGKQPFESADGRYVILFNGEIYNYLELRQGLLAKGYHFKTFSDTEVLLMAYIDMGPELLEVLNGMFAFVIYDNLEKTFFFARDHFGIKPLYYHTCSDGLIFGSEIKAILEHPSIESRRNDEALQEYLTFQLILGDKTLFKNILKLEPASYMVVDDRGQVISKRRYWEPKHEVDQKKSREEFLDETLVILENSLSIQVRSDVPVGSHLSGGIDSSTVAILASKNYYNQLKTFSGGFKDEGPYDETHYARLVSEKIHSDHYEVFPTVDDFTTYMEKIIYHMDEPCAGPGLFPQFMISKLASEHVKVVLGGQGGDEIFGGYTRYLVAYLEQCIKGSILDTQEEGNHIVTLQSILPNLTSLKNYLPMIKQQFSSGLFEDMDRRYYQLINRSPSLDTYYTQDVLGDRDDDQIFEQFSSIFNRPDTPSYFNKMTYFDIHTLLPALLHIEDRVSMAVSLESRVPLLDKRLVELAYQMPPTLKFAGGKPKYMLIESVKNLLPKEIIQRKDKMGFPVPFSDWMSQQKMRNFIGDVFNNQGTRERGLVKVDDVLTNIQTGGKFSRDLWGVLNMEMWHQKFLNNG